MSYATHYSTCCVLRDQLSDFLNYLVDLQDKVIAEKQEQGHLIEFEDILKFIKVTGKEKILILATFEDICYTCSIHYEKLTQCYRDMLQLTEEDIY